MNHDELLRRITTHPDILLGKPTIRGLRISVEFLLRSLAGGRSPESLLKEYPELEADDLRAAQLHARKEQGLAA